MEKQGLTVVYLCVVLCNISVRSLNNHIFSIFSGSYFCYDNPAALEKKIEQVRSETLVFIIEKVTQKCKWYWSGCGDGWCSGVVLYQYVT